MYTHHYFDPISRVKRSLKYYNRPHRSCLVFVLIKLDVIVLGQLCLSVGTFMAPAPLFLYLALSFHFLLNTLTIIVPDSSSL